ncbi:M35 family metallopeptidase [Planotetraspora sp. A-T 1434]|uniref:M35 family metallopeptidase n=1 Tax=Planotetraspora sp. A-T 1434 TaxID=2979219 RepID=UPI0021C1A7C2|nr:M35 family metallopeptidase [Planotetraspora sp. A-T 1434]MCT9933477.1 M35 family metallopeptidase [Planotetraspora sp. A-T 1434]
MIPVPTPALLKQITANENNVYASYRRLIDAALAKQATRGDSYQRLIVQWSKLNLIPPGEAKEGTARRRAAELPQFITDLNQLLAPAATQAQQPAEDFPPVAGSPWIIRLLKLVEEKVVRPIETGSPRAMASVRTCFGDEAAAAVPRFREILQQLQAIHARSDGKSKGMLYNPALPRSMGALGRGSGAVACIDLSSEFRPHLMSDVKAASTLVHEGSHTLAVEPTVDFAYRDAHAHYLLPPKLALLNAGNYEQVVIDLIGGMPGQLNAGEVEALRDGAGDSLAQVHALMCSRVVRAWVRVYDLIGLAANGRITAGELRGLPPLPSDSGPLLTAVLRELFAQLETLMSAVNDYLVLRLGAQAGGGLNRAPEQRTKDDPGAHQRPATLDDTQPLTFESTPTATTVTVSFDWASKGAPDAIARNILFELTDRIWQGKQAAFSGSEVAHVVQSIQLTDRPALRMMLEDYYARLSRKAKID